MGGEGTMSLTSGPMNEKGSTGTYAVLQCGWDSDYVRKVYGGYFRVFAALLAEDGEKWEAYSAIGGELPDEGAIDKYDGFVVTGSCADAHGNEPWILGLVAFLAKANAKKKRILGVCFGHQILCRALGGKTGRARKGWDIGVTCIHPTNAAMKLFSSLSLPSHFPVIEFHQDEVWELPPLAEVLANSDKTSVEMFRCGDHIMGIQGHPEYKEDILMSIINRLFNNNKIQTCHVEAAKVTIHSRVPDQEAWKSLCRSFLKGRLQW